MSGPAGDSGKTSSGQRAMVGRDVEMSRLGAIVDDALAGRSAFVSIVGDPGIGKTLLAARALDHARSQGANTSLGRCHEDATETPFRPWLQNLRILLEQPEATDLYDLLGVPFETSTVDETSVVGAGPRSLADRIRLFDRVTRTLTELSTDGGAVLLFEDVHWADSPSLLLLQFLAKEIIATGVAILVTHRPEQIYAQGPFAKAMRNWEAAACHQRIDLHGLPDEAVRELVEQEAKRFASETLAPTVVSEAAGNPLFIIQSVRHLLETEHSRKSGTSTSPNLPTDVHGVINERLQVLADGDRRVVEIAACLGSVFDLVVLGATCSELDETTSAVEAIDRALAADLVEEGARLGSYRFSHALIRESLLSNTEAHRKRSIHGAIVRAIETTTPTATGEALKDLASHSYAAAIGGDAEKAVHYAGELAHRSYFNFAFDESALWFERAIEILRMHDPGDAWRRSELMVGLAQSLAMAGRGQEAIERFSEAIELGRSAEHWRLFGMGVMGLSLQWGINSVIPGAESRIAPLLQEAIAQLPPDASDLRAVLKGRLASEIAPSRPELASEMADEAVELGRDEDLLVQISVAAVNRVSKWRPDNLDERLALSANALELATKANDLMGAASARTLRVIDLLESADVDNAKLESHRLKEATSRILSPFYVWQSGVVEAMWLLTRGAFQEAERVAQETMNRAFEHNAGDAVAIYSAFNYVISWFRGTMAPLEDGLVAAIQQFPVFVGWRAGLALVYAATERPDLAREQIDLLMSQGPDPIPCDASYLATTSLLAETASLLEDIELAELFYPMIEGYDGRLIVAGNAVACHGAAACFTADLASLRGKTAEADRLFEKGLQLESRAEAKPLMARTRFAWARHLLRHGHDEARAGDLLRRAHADAGALGMLSVSARIEAMPDPSGARTAGAESSVATPSADKALFKLAGDYRTIGFDALEIRLKETKGLAYTEHLLRHPEREFFAMELVGLVHGDDPEAATKAPRAGDAGETLDAQAVAQYRQRIEEAREELTEAEELNDLGRIDRLRKEIEFLADQLGSGLGIGGRKRKAASDNERARVNVTRAIRSAIRRIADEHPSLGRRLVATIKTGSCCSYNPDPDNPIHWEF